MSLRSFLARFRRPRTRPQADVEQERARHEALRESQQAQYAADARGRSVANQTFLI